MTSSKSILLIPDIHIPDQHAKAWANLLSFISDYQPDEIVQTGDLMDFNGPSRWSKASAMEYEDNFQYNLDQGFKKLTELREVYQGPIRVKKGNHDIRAEVYIARYGPALRTLRALQFDQLLSFDMLDIELLPRTPYKVAPGWLVAHGDEGRLARYAGGTAIGLARAYGMNVACGHTHRQGLIHETTGLNHQKLTGFELGNLMNEDKADYLKLPANWQLGFGLLQVHGGGAGTAVAPEPVQMDKRGGFYYQGQVYP